MRGLAVGSVTGIILANGVYLVANRLIPASSDGFGLGRANLEVLCFYLVWIGTYIHAALRGKSAWRDQCLTIAPVALVAVLLNWVTTGHHPIAAASKDLASIWSMDITLLAGAGIALFAAARLQVSDEKESAYRVELNDMVPEASPAG